MTVAGPAGGMRFCYNIFDIAIYLLYHFPVKDGDLIIGIMASFAPRRFGAGELAALARPCGVTAASVRTSLSRLTARGVIIRDKDGGKSVYGFSAKGLTITGNVAAGFHRPDWTGWDGTYWGIAFSLPAAAKSERYRLTKKLSLFRFAPLYPGYWIRPCREREKMEKKLENVFSNPHCTAVRFHPWRPLDNDKIEAMWSLNAVATSLRAADRTAEAALQRLKNTPPERAFAQRYATGGKIVSALFRDPLLPPAFLPRGWPADRLRGLFTKFDAAALRLSRPFWESVLGKGGDDDHH